MACIAVLPSAAGAAATGGVEFVEQVVSAPDGAYAGRETRLSGQSGTGRGEVAIDARLGGSDWLRIATATAASDGSFTATWTPEKAGEYEFRVAPVSGARTAADTRTGGLTVYRLQKATWYGPGFYGRRTACGQRLTKRTKGVAHRSLPCGSKVKLFANGRSITVPVIDRGPFVRGVVWDLTSATATALGITSTVRLGALPQ